MSSADWKKKNYSKKIKVSEATVAQLRKGTKAENIAKANKPGASAEYREAVRRFYGKDTTKAAPMAGGKTVKSGPRRVTSTSTSSTSSKPVSRKTSSGSPVKYSSPSSNMNIGSGNLTPAQYRDIASRQSRKDKVIGTAAQLAVPGMGGLKAVKALRAAKAAKAVKAAPKSIGAAPKRPQLSAGPKGRTEQLARTTTRTSTVVPSALKSVPGVARASKDVQRLSQGVKKGNATKGELNKAKLMLRAEIQAAAKKTAAKKTAAKPAPKAAPKPAPKPAPKAKPAPKKAPAKKTNTNDTQKMADEMFKRIGGRKPVRRTLKVGAAGYVAKKWNEVE